MNTIKNESHNLESTFSRLKRIMFITYKGYMAEKVYEKGRVMIFYEGNHYIEKDFRELIDNYIKSGKEAIGNSIKK